MLRVLLLAAGALIALAAQGLALQLLAEVLSGNRPLATFLGAQCLAAALFGLFVTCAFRPRQPSQRLGAFGYAFSVCFFLPVAGQLLFASMILAGIAFPLRRAQVDATLVRSPRFLRTSAADSACLASIARLRPTLSNPAIAAPERMAAMVALRTLPTRNTDSLLRDLLSDPLEEIRLLSYGISNGAENRIAQRILAAGEEIARTTTTAEKARLSSELAQLHWELVYQNLVQGPLRVHSLARAERYAHAALSLDDEQGGMWCLLGRCALLGNEPVRAERFLRLAERCHFPGKRLAPWLAEAAFMKREYGRIHELLAPLDDGVLPSLLQPSARFWI